MSQNKPTRLTDRKRAAILEAAVTEFRRSGFDNTSMDRIAEVAKVSKRTVYNHFPSKEELFAEIVNQLANRCQSIDVLRFEPDQPLESQLTRIGNSVIDVATSREFQNLARVVLSRFLQVPELAGQMLPATKEFEARLTEWIMAANEAGRLDVNNPKRAVKQFLGLIQTFALWPPLMGSEPIPTQDEKRDIVHTAVAMFLSHFAK